MSERMNKDRAKQFFEEIKEIAEKSNRENAEPIYDLAEELRGYSEKQIIEFCDIAIDSLQNDDLIERLENGECCKHSSNKVVAYNRDYLDENLEMEFDILKTTRDTVQAMRKGASDDEVAERLAKVVEPYERKE